MKSGKESPKKGWRGQLKRWGEDVEGVEVITTAVEERTTGVFVFLLYCLSGFLMLLVLAISGYTSFDTSIHHCFAS